MNNHKVFKHPLSREKVNDLINLELRFKLNYDKEDLDKIIDIFTQLVEYYDAHNDPMKYYYLEKIQDYTLEFNNKLTTTNNKKKKNISNNDFDTRKAIRSKNFNFLQNTKKELEESKLTKETTINDQIKKNDNKKNIIESSLKTQNDLIRMKLMKRKENSLIKNSASLSKLSFNSNFNNLLNFKQ